MKKTMIAITMLMLTLAFMAGCAKNTPALVENKNPIKIGFIGPLSGGPALWGQGSLDMVNMAVDEINAKGGVAGRELVVVPEDGKCQSEPAVAAINKLINIDGVKFILGGHCSPETAVIAPIADRNKVFMLAGVSTTTGILDNYSYAFRTSPPNWEQACLIGKVAIQKYNLKKIAILSASTAFTKGISNDFAKCFTEQNGNIVITEEYVWPSTTDFRTSLNKINELNPDALFIATQGVEGLEILKQIKELKMDFALIGNTVFISKQTYEGSQGMLSESSFTVAPYVDPSSDRASQLIEKYKSRYGKDVPYNLFFVGSAYDGTYMLAEALGACGEDAACVRDYFFGLDGWKGATADYSFNKKGDAVLNNWRELRIINDTEIFDKIKE